jgi:transcriptional regulator with XRE-family HTH domain
MKKINPQSLKHLRNRKGWSQKELATRTGMGKRRLVELEDCSVQFHDVRDSNFEDLCKALGATEAQLRGEEPITDPLPVNYVTLRSKISTIAQMNYDLIEAQYGIETDQIVQLAPLMFAILVEDSFTWRKQQLTLRKQSHELKRQLFDTVYDPYYGLYEDEEAELIRLEESAIDERQVFTRPMDAKLPENLHVLSELDEHPDNYFTDRLTDFFAAKVKSLEPRIRADFRYDQVSARSIQDPGIRYLAAPQIFEYLTDAEDEQVTAVQRLGLLSGAIRIGNAEESAKISGPDALREWFQDQLTKVNSETIHKIAELTPLVAGVEYRGDVSGKFFGFDDLGFPVMLDAHPLVARQRVSPESEGEENASA